MQTTTSTDGQATTPITPGDGDNPENKDIVRDPAAVLAKNKELLGEIARKNKDNEELRKLLNKEKEDKLKASGDLAGMVKLREEENERLKKQLEESQTEINQGKAVMANSMKLDALVKTVGDIDPKYFGLVDLDKIIVDPTTGVIDTASVLAYAKEYVTSYPETIRKGNFSRKMGETLPNNNGLKPMGYDEWKNLGDWKKMEQLRKSNLVKF